MNVDTPDQMPSDEPVYFENWRELGCQVIVNDKDVLTLSTPETSLGASDVVLVEQWVTQAEFCENLTAVLHAFGAPGAMLMRVEWERQNYLERRVEGPVRTTSDLLREIEHPADGLQS